MVGNPAKRLLEKYFTKEIDYKVEKLTPPIGGASVETLHGGQNKEHITFNINTFKKLEKN